MYNVCDVLGFCIFQIQESLIECAKQQNLELRFCQELAAAVAQKASSLAGRKVLSADLLNIYFIGDRVEYRFFEPPTGNENLFEKSSTS